MYYCNRCGTPLQPGDHFCPRCGAPAGSGTPGRAPGPKRNHTAGIVAAMAAMVLLLLAAAVWSQRGSFGRLFDPAPTPRPGQEGSERVSRPATDEAGSPVIELDEALPEQDMARALLADAGEDAFYTLYGSEPISRAEASGLFCNLAAGGYKSALDKAMEVNAETVGSLSRWDGCLLGRPLMAGNCGYVLAMLYSVSGSQPPLQIDYATVRIGLLWTGSSWRVDASGQAARRWEQGGLEPSFLPSGQRRSAKEQEARAAGRAVVPFAEEMRLIQPVIPGVCDAMPVVVYRNPDGSYGLEFWAFNGSDTALDAQALEEVRLRETGGGVCFELYDFAMEPLHLDPGEGRMVALTVPADAVISDPQNAQGLTCAVWFYP